MQRDELPLRRGADWKATWSMHEKGNPDAPWIWQPTDLVRGEVRAGHSGGTLLHTWTRGNEDVVTADGQLTLIITGAVSETWTAYRAVADVIVERPGAPLGERESVPIFMTLVVEHGVTPT
jgi:hypothetical protein